MEFGGVRLEETSSCRLSLGPSRNPPAPIEEDSVTSPKSAGLRRRLGLKLYVLFINGTLKSLSLSSVKYFTSCYALSHNVFNVN